MNTYYNIKSPIESNKGLRKIVEAYLNDDSKKSFYSRAVCYGEKNNKFDDKEFGKFQDKINCMEFDRIRALDEKMIKRESLIRKNFIGDAIIKLKNRRNRTYDNPSYEQYKLVQKYSNSELLRMCKSAKSGNMNDLSNEEIGIVKLFDDYLLSRHTFRGIAGYHVYAEELETEREKIKKYAAGGWFAIHYEKTKRKQDNLDR